MNYQVGKLATPAPEEVCVRLDTVALTASCPPAVRLQHGDVPRARRQRDRAQPQQQELTVSSRAPPTPDGGARP